MPNPFIIAQRRPHFGAPTRTSVNAARPRFGCELQDLVSVTADPRPLLAVGAGGAGGDIADAGEGRLIDLTGLDRVIRFDPAAGRIRVQAGVSILDCLGYLAERGHFLPVVPAWSKTTVGGAVATDVHGPNHDAAGSFGAWVRALRLHRSDQPARDLQANDPSGMFEATLGGLGLTGVIEWVEIETRPIRSSLMAWEAETFESLADLESLFAQSQDWVYRRAWLDAARPGRGRFERFRHAQDGPIEARTPQPLVRISGPVSRGIVNGLTTAAFAGIIERRGPAARRRDYASVFFPFEDAVDGFEHVFGRKGCIQYQAVIGRKDAFAALQDILAHVKKRDDSVVLLGLTEFGPKQPAGLMSFAREGFCLTVRARNLGERTSALFGELDSLVVASNGRINPCTDLRFSRTMLERGYPNLDEFVARIDPAMRSEFRRRVLTA